ncbi:MAG: Methyltransferase type 11 [Acidimicrobiales bacterium]|nr:Methyltransferase type 11 [Acidimicrobiales bacterium]
MEFDDLQQNWESFGKTDALWAVLTSPGKRYNRWNTKEFFRTGEEEVDRVLGQVDRLGWSLGRGRVLDFGCGVGRLTQAFAAYFAVCDGVDIASSMIKRAQHYNRHGSRCRFHLNPNDDLRLFEDETFDLVYSAHVLQHMAPRYSRRYVDEFLRVLRPGGLALFQMTTEPTVGATEALSDEAFRATVELQRKPLRIAPGAKALIPVRVVNRSFHPWPAGGKDGWYLVSVGNHWLDCNGERVVIDDARARLGTDVQPGHAAVVELEVRAPDDMGEYQLEVDLVQEGVGWFGDRGSSTARRPAEVRPPSRWWRRRRTRGVPPLTDVGPTMEMYGVPRDEISEWIEAAGGRVVDVFDWNRISGQQSSDWRRFCFVAARA